MATLTGLHGERRPKAITHEISNLYIDSHRFRFTILSMYSQQTQTARLLPVSPTLLRCGGLGLCTIQQLPAPQRSGTCQNQGSQCRQIIHDGKIWKDLWKDMEKLVERLMERLMERYGKHPNCFLPIEIAPLYFSKHKDGQ